MAVSNWEFSYNGLTFGGANPFGVTRVEGLDPPDSKLDEVDKAEDHGSWTYGQYLQAREVTIEGDVYGDAASGTFEGLINAFRAAFTPQGADLPLSYLIPGDVGKRVNCIPVRRHFDIDTLYSLGYTSWTVMLLAGDPRIYSDALNANDLTVFTPFGVSFNVVFSINFGGGTGGTANIINAGGFYTYPVLNLYGPITDARISNNTQGKTLALAGTVNAGDYLAIDMGARTALLNGLYNRYSMLNTPQWWSLQPGANSISLAGNNTTGATKVTVQWRDAWI